MNVVAIVKKKSYFQLHSSAFMCSGIYCGVVRGIIFDVSKKHVAFKCKVQTPLKVGHEIYGTVNSERNQDGVEGFYSNNVKMHIIYFVYYSFSF